MSKRNAIYFLLLFFGIFASPILADDWSDLEEPEVSGRDAEGNYPFNLGYLIYYEDWKNENNEQRTKINVFWLWQKTWYPKYNSTRMFPFYFSKQSKIDDRAESLFLPLYYSQTSIEKKEKVTSTFAIPILSWWQTTEHSSRALVPILPIFYYHSKGNYQNTTTDNWGALGFFRWNEISKSGQTNTGAMYPVLFYTDNISKPDTKESTTNILLLSHYSKKEDSKANSKESSYWLFPIFRKGTTSNLDGEFTSLWAMPYYQWSEPASSAKPIHDRGKFFPVLFYTSDTTQYATDIQNKPDTQKREIDKSTFNIMLLSHHSKEQNNLDQSQKESHWWMLPLVYSGNSDDRQSSTDSLFAFGYYSWNNTTKPTDTNIASSQFTGKMFPILFYTDNISKPDTKESTTNILLLSHYSKKEDSKANSKESSYWLFPIFRKGTTSNSDGEFTSLWAMPYYQWSEPASSAKPIHDRGKFFPVLFYTSDTTQYATDIRNKPDTQKLEIDKSTFNIMLLSHHSKEQNNLDQSQKESHWWMLPLVYTGNSDDRKGSTDSLFAFGYYSWNNINKPADPINYKPNKQINEDINNSETDGDTSNDTSKTREITDYSYNSELADTTSQSTGKMFPVLFYTDSVSKPDTEESTTNILLLSHYSKKEDSKANSKESSYWLFPIFRKGTTSNSDGEFTSLWAMPYYQWNEPASSEKPIHDRGKFFPVLFYTSDTTQYATDIQNKPDTQKLEIDKSTFNIMLLSHHSKEQNNLDQSKQESHWWMLPLVYSGNSDDRKGSTDSLFAFGYYSWNNINKPADPINYKPNKQINEDINNSETDGDTSNDTSKTREITDYSYNSELADTTSQSTGKMFPVLFYTDSLSKPDTEESTTNILLLSHYSKKEDSKANSKESSYWLFPIFRKGTTSNSDGEFTSLWAMPYYQWNEPASSAKPIHDRGKFFPVLFYTSDTTQYATDIQNKPDTQKLEINKSTLNIMLLSHHSKEQNNLDQSKQESHWWMLPLVYSGNSDDRKGSTDSLFAFGYYSWNNINNSETDSNTSKTREITDYSYNSELADTTSQSTGKMFPVLFYWSNHLFESGKNENFWNIGLLWNHTRLTDEVGDSISLKQHLLPLYYHNIDEDSSFWMMTPLYWQNRDFKSEELYRISPIYYSHQWKETIENTDTTNNRRTDWALLYYSWNHHDSEGETIFPLYYRTKNDEKEWKLYAMGAVTTGSAMLEFQQDSVFLDTDLYVGYGLFGMSNRLPIYDKSLFNKWFRGEKSPTTQKDEYNQVQVVGENTEIVGAEKQVVKEPQAAETLTHNKEDDSFDRENTKLYNKWTSFFGLSSYIQADSKRHFRIIPLAWLSWDTENKKDDVAFYFPGYANYQTDEEHYLAVFPFMLPVYGRHDKGDSYTMNIGGFVYIESYEADEKDFSRHIIWPFYKGYKNQVEEGSRLFPIYSNRTWTDEEGKHNRHFSLVHYRHSVEKENQKLPETTTVSPVYISGNSSESNWSFWTIPLLYRSTEIKDDTTISSWRAMVLASGETSSNGDQSNGFFPFYSYENRPSSNQSTLDILLGLGSNYSNEQESGWYAFPFYAKKSWTYNSIKKQHSLSLLHYSFDSEEKTTRWFLPGLYYSSKDNQGNSNWSSLLLFGGSSDSKAINKHWILPFYSYQTDTTKNSTDFSALLGLFGNYSSDKESGWYIFPLYGSKSVNENNYPYYRSMSLLHYQYESENYKQRWFLPALYYSWTKRTESMETSEWSAFLITGGESNSREESWYVFPFAYYKKNQKTQSADFTALFGLISNYSNNKESGWYMFPLYGSKSGTETNQPYYQNISLLHYWYNSETKRTLWLLPALYYSSTERKDNLQTTQRSALLIFGGQSNSDGLNSNWVFPFYSYEQDPTKNSTDFKALFGIFSNYSNNKESGWYMLPLLGSKTWTEKNESHYRNISLLHWWHTTETVKERNLLGGFAWFNNENQNTGWHSKGILWGGLWRKQYDTKTGYRNTDVLLGGIYEDVYKPKERYKSFSILQGIIYSNVENDETGLYYRRFLGLQIRKAADDRMD